MLHIGIDWGDQAHQVCVVDDRGKERAAFPVKHNAEGLTELLTRIQALESDKSRIVFCLETSHGLLVEFLLDHGYTLYPVNPKASERCRQRYKVSGSKNDVLDARVLADFVRTDRAVLRPLQPSSPLARELKLLVQARDTLVRTQTRLVNQLIAALKSYYPGALDLFDDPQADIALAFLEAFPTSADARRLTRAKLQKFLRAHRYSRPDQIPRLWEALQAPWIPVDDFLILAQSQLALALVHQLQVLHRDISSLEKTLQDRVIQHPDVGIFRSLPAAGRILHAQVLAHFGDNRDVYPTFQSLQRQAGTCPITKQSGAFRSVHFRRACNRSFRNVLHTYAFASLTQSLWAKRYYQKKRREGLTHQSAVRCLANVWAKIIHTLWIKRIPYDENVRLAGCMRQELHRPVLVGG